MIAPEPWYRSGWVWFIVGLLSVTVVGSLTTVAIAYRLGDLSVVSEELAPRTPPATER